MLQYNETVDGTGMIKTSHELLKNAKHNCPYEKNLRQDDADKLMKHIPGEWHGGKSDFNESFRQLELLYHRPHTVLYTAQFGKGLWETDRYNLIGF